jgi:hypothetical protein
MTKMKFTPRNTSEPAELEHPRSTDQLFKSEKDWHFNACLDFRFRNSNREYGYIEGYKLAADALFEKVLQDRFVVDLVIYPMVFNYRHYVELSLKAILFRSGLVLETQGKPKYSHNLEKLWEQLRPLLQTRFKDHDFSVLDNVEKLILEFSGVDPKSTAFRYHEHNPGQKEPAITTETEAITHINVRNLFEVMGRLAVFFDGVLAQLHVDWDNMCEAKSYEQEAIDEMEAEWQSEFLAEFSQYQDHEY